MSIHERFAALLFEYRSKNDLTQRDVADLCGISLRHYQELEIGRSVPQLPTAIRIATALNLSLDSLKDEVAANEVSL